MISRETWEELAKLVPFGVLVDAIRLEIFFYQSRQKNFAFWKRSGQVATDSFMRFIHDNDQQHLQTYLDILGAVVEYEELRNVDPAIASLEALLYEHVGKLANDE